MQKGKPGLAFLRAARAPRAYSLQLTPTDLKTPVTAWAP